MCHIFIKLCLLTFLNFENVGFYACVIDFVHNQHRSFITTDELLFSFLRRELVLLRQQQMHEENNYLIIIQSKL